MTVKRPPLAKGWSETLAAPAPETSKGPRNRSRGPSSLSPPSGPLVEGRRGFLSSCLCYMPIGPCPPPPPPSSLSFGRSATIASVVSISEATDAAFCSAVRDTLVGSITPAASRSS